MRSVPSAHTTLIKPAPNLHPLRQPRISPPPSLRHDMWMAIAKRASSSLLALAPPKAPPRLFPSIPSSILRRAPLLRAVSSVAEDISSTDVEEEASVVDEREHLQAVAKPNPIAGATSTFKYTMLKRRQIKIETEAWEQAAKEYRELLADMCKQKLAPNLPCMKSLFIVWFEPLRNRIAEEQELCKDPECRAFHAPYFTLLPPDMMAVITMHKLMGLLMTGTEGSTPLVLASLQVGGAIEHEVRIRKLLEKTRKKPGKTPCGMVVECEPVSKEQENLRKKLTSLMKKQKLHQVRRIVKDIDPTKAWGEEHQARVGSRLIELLIDIAYIQPPVSQSADSSFDIRPAFCHEQKRIVKDDDEPQASVRRYGVVTCDPMIRQGLERTWKVYCSAPRLSNWICAGKTHGDPLYANVGASGQVDRLGASVVNLLVGEKPADAYSEIAERVYEIMRRDAEKDPAVDQNALHAKFLLNQVDRKLVKQTVMTSVYGVTFIGARAQINRRLKERGLTDTAELFGASCYAARVTLVALGEMFQAARGIMNWLGDCAKIIAMENYPVRWVTPIGLPVVQPYHIFGRKLVKTSLQVLTLKSCTDKVMVQRQRTAFPPNFVHSLDGSHMMMTAISCKHAGLNFAGVHDSYWTHACDVDVMNQILREKFVELYETPILENLLEDFQKSFPSLKFPPLPERGDLDLNDVLSSTYFFN